MPYRQPLPSSLPFVADLSTHQRRELQWETAQRLGVTVAFRDLAPATPEMIVVPAGSFEMGAGHNEFGARADELPQRIVAIERPFALGRFTITADEFAAFTEASGWRWRPDLIRAEGRHPVMNIRIADAEAYCRWLSERTGHRYRLPNEAEWEYACRAGTRTPFSFGESISCKEVHFNAAFPYDEARAGKRWFLPRCVPLPRAIEVGEKPPNLWGLHEMHGNVWEFCQDPWRDDHRNRASDGGAPARGRNRRIVVKGGSWFDAAVFARSAARRPRLRDELDVNLGFRVLRELDGDAT